MYAADVGPHWVFWLLYGGGIQLLWLLQIGFTIWMAVDAYRKGAESFWIWIIVLFQPVGAWVYFFVYKIHDLPGIPGLGGLGGWMAKRSRPSMQELRYRVDQSATFTNQLAIGERLVEDGQCAEAVPYLEAALKREPEHGQVLFLLARCRVSTGQPREAETLLRKIMAKDRHWSNYAAWKLLVEALGDAGDHEAALATARELAQLTQSLEHRCLLAEELMDRGEQAEARKVLEHALTEHQYVPGPLRRRSSSHAAKAKKLLKQMG